MLLAWGLLLSAHQLELVSLTRSWPLLVVAAGASILVNGFDHGAGCRRRRES